MTPALMIFSDRLEYQWVQLTSASDRTCVLQIDGMERTSLISRNRHDNGSTSNVSTFPKNIFLIRFLHAIILLSGKAEAGSAEV